jgi:1,4-dihydroxy-2-naphthoate octaprenyltransferase
VSDPRPGAAAPSHNAGVPAPGATAVWIHAARVPTLAAAAVPVLVGSAMAARDGAFRAGPAAAALLGAILIQVGTNLANDLGDHRRGADTGERLGPRRALQQGWLTPAQVRSGAALCFALASVAGVYLAWAAGWPVIAIGLASIAAGVAYTAGPWPLAYNGLGEVFVFLFFGVVAVCGTYFVQARALHPWVLLASVPVGALATAILVVNNVRDIETDRGAGKRTLAVRMGRDRTRGFYSSLLMIAYLGLFALVISRHAGDWALLPLLTLPLAFAEIRRVALREDGPSLNRALRGTARLQVLFGTLFAIGLLLP